MSRRRRAAPGGYIYHVINRANERARLFASSSDYAAFEKTLAEALGRIPTRLLSYCLMPNHWHLVLWPCADDELSSFMAWVTGTHAVRWRKAHETIGFGHVYQDRFKSFAVESDPHFLTVCRYVERNPLRANLVSRAEEWPWCSLPAHTTEKGKSSGMIPLSDWPIPIPMNWLQWVNTPQTRGELSDLRASLRKNLPFGSVTWKNQVIAQQGFECTVRGRGRPRNERTA